MKVSYLIDSQSNTFDTTRLDKMSSEPESFPFTQSKWAEPIISELRELFATSMYSAKDCKVTFEDAGTARKRGPQRESAGRGEEAWSAAR